MVACTIMIEGTKLSNIFTMNEIKKIAKRHRGVIGGSENGRAGYNLTHSIAYIRDFLNAYGIICESFETSIEWDKVELMAEHVKNALYEEANKSISTKPFISYRISQTYNTGVCVYFSFGFYKDVNTSIEYSIQLYHHLEKIMRKVMLEHGGSVSHHHGIGQIKTDDLLNKIELSQLELHKHIKLMFDKPNVFCENNLLYIKSE